MLIWVRSLLFQAYFYLSVVPFGLASLLLAPVPVASYRVARAWGAAMLRVGKLLCGLEYTVEGQEHFPDRPSVVLAKHSSVWEVCALLALLPRHCWVLKRELFMVPFFGWGLRALQPIAIDRSAGRTAVRQVISQGSERLAEGIWVVIFPEGTRVAPGTTRKYGVSGAALANETGAPIVPVAHNAGDLWPRRSLLKKPGLIRVRIGPAVDATAQSPKETNAIVQTWIESAIEDLSGEHTRGRP